MKPGIALMTLLLVPGLFAAPPSVGGYDPVADPNAVSIIGNVRFTALTPRIMRIEYSPSGKFEDRASYAFVNRKTPVPAFRKVQRGAIHNVKTELINLFYDTSRAGPPSAANLTAKLVIDGEVIDWSPDMRSTNLGGTTRTLDGVSGSCELEPGIFSREGFTLIDDSKSIVFDHREGTDWPWAAARPDPAATDWYLFVHGSDYKGALADFTAVAGRIPLPPRYALGAWWSRYWAYSDGELRQLVKEFREHDVPLDVLVVDMDWHLDGWTGYSWNPQYFPDPDGFLKWTAEEKLRVPLNLHPADGVGKHETRFKEFCEAVGVDAATTDRVPFDCTDPKFVKAYFEVLHHPLEKQGIDFWWMDWQQGRASQVDGLDPLPWLNYLHWTDWERNPGVKPSRPLVFSRWGGLGNHRYQVGFSGDTFCDWPSLAFQPSFTATAGNVGYAWWSHDIGGHQPGKVDPELYARWIQWGAFSPVLRTHTTKNPLAERRIWEFPPEFYNAMKAAWRLRYSLLPYTYSAGRECYDTGVPLCRPLYYHWPLIDRAYNTPGQYMFGESLMIAPVLEPRNPANRLASIKVWIPPGEWTLWAEGRQFAGPSEARLLVPMDTIPIFVRAGDVLPMANVGRNSEDSGTDTLTLVGNAPGWGDTRLYEDDGLTQAYQKGEFAWTPIKSGGQSGFREVTLRPAQGTFPGAVDSRILTYRARNLPQPTKVVLNGEPLAQSEWSFDNGFNFSVQLPPRPVKEETKLRVEYEPNAALEKLLADGLAGDLRVLAQLSQELGEAAPPELAASLQAAALLAKGGNTSEAQAAAYVGKRFALAAKVAVSALPEPRRSEFVCRLLGLWTKLSLVALDGGNQPPTLTANAEVALSSPFVASKDVQKRVRFVPPENWKLAPGLKLEQESRDDVMNCGAALESSGPPQTGVLRAEIELTAGETKIAVPIEQVLYPSINAWWILGPMTPTVPESLDAEMAAMTSIDDSRSYDGKDGKPARWRRFERKADAASAMNEFFINFTNVYGERTYGTNAYVATILKSPRDQEATLAVGSDDGVIVWLNGQEVHRYPHGRAYASKADRVNVTLKQGTNVLMMRIMQGTGDWGFGVHVETRAGKPLPEVEVSLRP
ncbi:Alpha-xylosidase [Phycisphaerae bacterium RAS1]|nr:Alpha-xylosidase [Phycisphaerae bacterium RAS1]